MFNILAYSIYMYFVNMCVCDAVRPVIQRLPEEGPVHGITSLSK